MTDKYNLNRFISAQNYTYEIAFQELREGQKRSHWMWFIFPQLTHLGHSATAKLYGISGRDEAAAYLDHPLLGARLREVSETILALPTSDAVAVFGTIDARKLRSSMTLYDAVCPDDIFARVLDMYFDGKRDHRTTALIESVNGADGATLKNQV